MQFWVNDCASCLYSGVGGLKNFGLCSELCFMCHDIYEMIPAILHKATCGDHGSQNHTMLGMQLCAICMGTRKLKPV